MDESKVIKDDRGFLNVDITVSDDSLEDDLFKIYSELFKDVKKEDLVFEELKGGYVNSIQRVYPKKDKSKSLVFRTFGMKLNTEEFNKSLNEAHSQSNQANGEKKPNESVNNETSSKDDKPQIDQSTAQQPPADLDINTLFFNRITEYQVMNEASKHGLCQPVFAKYNNGLCYGFTEGITLNGKIMLSTEFLEEMATKLAKFHSIECKLSNIQFDTHFDRMNSQIGPMIEHMIKQVDLFMDSVDEFPYNKFPRLASLNKIESKIMELWKAIGEDEIVFCHNDCNQKNVIWNSKKRTLGFIDFEMAMNNYAGMEIGELFYCFTGHFLVDFNGDFFPNADYRRRFLRRYLEERNRIKGVKLTNEEFDEKLEKLFQQTNLWSLFFMLRILTMTPFFDVSPGLFKNEELDKSRLETKHYCGLFGYQVYEFFNEIKDDLLKSAEDYLKARKQVES